jgi:hypothetical protein
MKTKLSLLKKVKLFRFYRKTIQNLSFELETTFNARIDGASRIYTVINIPSSLIEEPYNLRKEDIDNLAKNFIRDYSQKISYFLNQNKLMELYDFYEVKKVDKYSYLLVFGFSLFNSQLYLRNFYMTIISIILLSSIILTLLII